MILKRRDKSGKIRYGVRGPKKKWGGTFPELGNPRKEGTAKWKEAQMFGATQPKAGPTCGEFARRWLAQDCPRLSGRKLKSDTIKEFHQRLGPFIKKFDHTPLDGIPRDQAFEWALEHRSSLQNVATMFHH